MTRILLIDDDEKLAPLLAEYFARFQIDLDAAARPSIGLELLARNDYDLVVLDVMMPEQDGFEVCRKIRRDNDIPIIMLTARGEVTDRVVGLELGADDYLAKPFEPRELVARIQNILRRADRSRTSAHLLRFEELAIDLDRRQVTVNDQPVQLTTMEYQLLTVLAGSPGKNFTRDQILNQLKGTDVELFSRSVDILVSRLRTKLKPAAPIQTVYGSGYAFVGKQQ